MPRIPDQLLNSVVYLFQNKEDALAGRGAGGTAFIVDYEDDGYLLSYVVSNIHVVRAGCTTVRVNTKAGGVDALTIPPNDWADHRDGDDVSVAPFPADDESEWAVEGLQWGDLCPTPARFEELNVGVGDEVLMLGRFSGHSGNQQNQPLARFGNLAMMDGEKVRDGRGMMVDAYLAEMRSLPGFSGSPVFLCIGAGSYRGASGAEVQPKMMPFYTETIGLLGIDTGHKNVKSPVVDKAGKRVEPVRFIEQNSGVAIVAPYYKINDVLEGDELMREREAASEDAFSDPERGKSDVAPDDAGEFERFEDLTRKLVNTPKPGRG